MGHLFGIVRIFPPGLGKFLVQNYVYYPSFHLISSLFLPSVLLSFPPLSSTLLSSLLFSSLSCSSLLLPSPLLSSPLFLTLPWYLSLHHLINNTFLLTLLFLFEFHNPSYWLPTGCHLLSFLSPFSALTSFLNFSLNNCLAISIGADAIKLMASVLPIQGTYSFILIVNFSCNKNTFELFILKIIKYGRQTD